MRDGDIEPTVYPRNPLDVLAQQIVAMTASGDELEVPALHDTVRRAYPFSELSRELLDSVLDVLDGRYPLRSGRAPAAHRLGPCGGHDPGPPRCAPARRHQRGQDPDRGLYGVRLPDGRRVGELDEEMVSRLARGRRSCSEHPRGGSRRSPATA